MLKLNKKTVDENDFNKVLNENKQIIEKVCGCSGDDERFLDSLDWVDLQKWASEEKNTLIYEIAKEIREEADAFILIGVGGSNQGARAVIKALQDKNDKVKIYYAGNNLEGKYLKSLLEDLEGKVVYANIIAKNFATLEPGIHFRVIRQWMEERYTKKECAKRIIATGTLDSSLNDLADLKGYRMLPFPDNVGGRYSVITPVGLLPIAVAGLDINAIAKGASDLKELISNCELDENPVVRYAINRKIANKGKTIVEVLANFDVRLEYFMKWWVQLIGESQGKELSGIFPAACNYTEDLHSMGQYLQDGRRDVIETFIKIDSDEENVCIKTENSDIDNFAYLDNKYFYDLNNAAYNATVKAHSDGGIMCQEVVIKKLDEYYFGQLFYFFMTACYLSAELDKINAFDQPGVEAYKTGMFSILKEVK